jgi:type II secretory pathway pseudopilin PulG
MKRTFIKTMGVTLLEIMLVLAIAAMVIVMSIRYYQSSTSSQQANATMEAIQGISAAMDNIANGGGGSYSGITTSTLTAVVGSANMTSVTNQDITYSAGDATSYEISIPLTEKVCVAVLAKLQSNEKVSSTAACNGGTLSYTYDNTK